MARVRIKRRPAPPQPEEEEPEIYCRYGEPGSTWHIVSNYDGGTGIEVKCGWQFDLKGSRETIFLNPYPGKNRCPDCFE